MKKVLSMLLATMMLLSVFTFACAEGKIKIGLISFNEATESSKLIATGVRNAAEEYKDQVELVTADINSDQSQVVKKVDELLVQGVDAIIDATWNEDVGAKVAQKCRDENVILISCDCVYDDMTHMVGADNYVSGTIIGAYMADYVKEVWDGKVDGLVILNEEAAGETTKKRMNGGIDALREGGIDIPDEKILWFDSMGQMLKARDITTDYLTAHADQHNILIGCLNDESGLGALAAVQSSGREEDCLIYSYGGEPSSGENFKKEENCWIATVNFNLNHYGDILIPSIIDLKAGVERPMEQSPDLNVIDRSNVREYYPD